MGKDALMQSAYTQAALNSPEELRKAALAVADRAIDAADCALLLNVLGLTGTSTRLVDIEHGLRGYRKGCKCPTCTAANRNRNRKQRSALKQATAAADAPGNAGTEGGR